MAYIVEFVSGDNCEILAKCDDKVKACEAGQQNQATLKVQGKHGIISLYEQSTEKGVPMRKCYEFWEV